LISGAWQIFCNIEQLLQGVLEPNQNDQHDHEKAEKGPVRNEATGDTPQTSAKLPFPRLYQNQEESKPPTHAQPAQVFLLIQCESLRDHVSALLQV
jgi:hypothetical protein